MLNITDTRTGTQKTIYPYPNRVGSVGDAMIGHKYRFNWNSPIALSPQNPSVVYFGGNVLFKSSNHGNSFQVISPDLTTNDPAKQQNSGGLIVVDNTAAEFHSTLLSISPSPLDSMLIWTSSDDGLVQVTRDGGKTWSSMFKNVPGLKPAAWLATVEASHFDVGTAYVVADHHQDDDYAPYVYMTTDFGKTWKPIMGDLSVNAAWTHVVREDPKNRNLLYLGTEMGAWASWDRGSHWVSLRGELPIVPVRDIQIHPRENDLLLATHGRGLYILDDITALQQLGAAMNTDATLFPAPSAIRWNQWNKDGNLGQKTYRAENPPDGAMLTYFLKAQPPTEVNVSIADKDGRVVRRMNRVLDDAGLNRVSWDLRYDAAPGGGGGGGRGRGAGSDDAEAGGAPIDTSLSALRARRRAAAQDAVAPTFEGFGPAGAPFVLPGVYAVTLTADGKKYTTNVTVQLDPRSDMSAAQLVAQHDAARRMDDVALRVNRVITNIDDVSRQMIALQVTLRATTRDSSARTANQALTEIDGALKDLKQFRDSVLARPVAGLGYRQYPRLREEVQTVAGMISRPMMAPTAGELLRAGELRTESDEAASRFDNIMQTRVARINELLKGSPHVIAPLAPRTFVP